MKLGRKIIAIVSAIAILSTVALAAAVGGYIGPRKTDTLYQKAIDDHGFIYGLNYAWVGDQQNSIGDNQIKNKKSSFDEKSVRSGLYNISKLGVDCTTIWLFMAGDGLEFDETGDVLGVQPIFLKNLETILKIAKEYNVHLSFTVQPHFDYNLESGLYSGSKEIYDKYSRMVTDPKVRSHYIENAVRPVLKLIAKYKEIIFAISAFCEPEGDIYGSPNGWLPFGTTKEVMADFISSIVTASRQELKNIPVWITCGWAHDETLQYFNKLDLDFIGRDIYDDYSKVPSISDAYVTTPVVLGEFGPGESADSTNHNFHMKNYKNFIQNAKAEGYTGAFYWMYNGKGSLQSLLGTSDNDYLPMFSSMYFTILDDINAKKGIEVELDKPVPLAADLDGTLSFITSRNAEKYFVERSSDAKVWKQIDTLDAGEVDQSGNLIGKYLDSTAEANKTYYYRFTAMDFDGNKAVSDVSLPVNFAPVTCSEKENLISDFGFEKAAYLKDTVTVLDDAGIWSLVNGTVGEVTHSGNNALKCSGNGQSTWEWVYKTAKVKPNTNYTFTFFANTESGTIQYKVLDAAKSHPNNLMLRKTTSAVASGWTRYTVVFNSGTATEVQLAFANGGGVVTVDDMYLFPI